MRQLFHWLTLFCVALLSLTFWTSPTFAQTDPLESSAAISHETATNSTNNAALLYLTAKTHWQISIPDTAFPQPVSTSERAAVLSLKPAPITLTGLAQVGRSDSIVGLEFSVGGMRPGGELRNTNLIRSAVVIGIGAGFRPPAAPPLQFDVGVDLILDGIGSPREQEIFPGYFRDINDVETLLYFGPRVYLTPRDSRLQFSLGGGGAFAYYKEFLESDEYDPFNFRCFSCEGRSGWGFYAMGQLRYQINPIFGVGVTAKYYRVTTEGEAFSNNLPRRTTDDWLGFMLTFSFR